MDRNELIQNIFLLGKQSLFCNYELQNMLFIVPVILI